MVQKFIPGFENDLYVDRDWLGDPVPKFSVISSMSENPINKVAAELNYQPIPLRKSKRITVDALEGKDGQMMRVRCSYDCYSSINRERICLS